MDFYVILGLSPSATTADIKRAYRRLARRYHPGVNPGDRTAEAMFQQVFEAYETLVDPERRRQYDSGEPAPRPSERPATTFQFAEFDFSMAARGAQAATFSELFADVLHPTLSADRGRPDQGADLHAALTVSFVEAMRGVERQVVVTRQVPCGACAGVGQVPTPEGRCAACQGTGRTRGARGHMVFAKSCGACDGSGRQRFQRCAACTGHGRAVRSEPVPVLVPPGTADGARVRVTGMGHAGRNGGRAGDLSVTVHVQPHPLFSRDGDVLRCRVPVAVHEAALGAWIEVPTIDGPMRLRIPPGTQGGQEFRLAGRGIPAGGRQRGDLVVEVRLVLPAALDGRSKALLREFGERNPGDVRKDLFS